MREEKDQRKPLNMLHGTLSRGREPRTKLSTISGLGDAGLKSESLAGKPSEVATAGAGGETSLRGCMIALKTTVPSRQIASKH